MLQTESKSLIDTEKQQGWGGSWYHMSLGVQKNDEGESTKEAGDLFLGFTPDTL